MNNHEKKTKKYRVKLGHSEVTVDASSAAEAIAQARKLLSAQLPRFYDVIRSAAATRFEVNDAA